jgi:hypothetical protein
MKSLLVILLSASAIVSLPSDDVSAVIPETELALNDPIDEATVVQDFSKDGIYGGLKDIAKQEPGLGHTFGLGDAIDEAVTEAGSAPATMSMGDYVKEICKGVKVRGAGTDSSSTVLAALKPTMDTFDKVVGPLCDDQASNHDQIVKLTRQLKSDIKEVDLPDPAIDDKDTAIVEAIGRLRENSADSAAMDASIQKYCDHGDFSPELKDDQPILKQLKDSVNHFDKCMQCVCSNGMDHCLDTPDCEAGIEAIAGVGVSLSQAEGFLGENGELIESLGPKHYEAIHRIMKHTAAKKVELHKRHGPNPTKEQFHEVFSANDLAEQSLVQVRGCHGMSAATAVEFRSGAISCGFDCNEYHGVQEASLSCDAFGVVKVEIGVTFNPLTLFLKLKLCAPGVSDVIGEIQKIPFVNAILSKFGLDGGCLLLGIGYIDFTNGIGEIKPGSHGLLNFDVFHIVRASLSARAFFRWDSSLPTANPFSHDCHRNDFMHRNWVWKTLCPALANLFGNHWPTMKAQLGYHSARDWWNWPASVTQNLPLAEIIHRAEDWFGIKAYAKLEVFCPCGWPWEFGMKTVWEQTFYQNTWRTGNY